jgi:MFS family permease
VSEGVRARARESVSIVVRVLREPDIRRLLLALAGSYVGYWGFTVALGVWAYQRGGAGLVGVAAFVRLAPSALFGPFMGLVADRYPRARVMVVCDLTRAVLLGGVAVAVAAQAPAAVVIVPLAVVSLAGGVFRPAQAALMPALARTPEELTAANAAAATIESVGIFLGPALGGVLLIVASPQAVFAVVAVVLLLSAALVARISTRPTRALEPTAAAAPSDTEERLTRELLAGVRLLVVDPGLRVFTGLFAAQALVAGAMNVLVVVVALRVLDRSQAWVGYLEAAGGIGGVVGGVAAVGLAGRRALSGAFAVAMLMWGVPLVVLGGVPGALTALAAWAVCGAGNTIGDVAGFTLLQRAAPEHLLARAFAALDSVLFGSIALGGLLAPLVIAALGDRGALIAIGALLPVLTLLARPKLARVDAGAAPPEREVAILRALPIFAPLPAATLEHLARSLTPATFASSATVFHQGEPGDRFYVIDSGSAKISVDGQAASTLGPGEAFGEIALLRATPRTATVKAAQALEALTLDRDEFLAAVTGHAASTAAADEIVAARLARARPALASL